MFTWTYVLSCLIGFNLTIIYNDPTYLVLSLYTTLYYGGTLGLPLGGTDGGSTKRTATSGGGNNGRTGGGPSLTRTSTAKSIKERGLANSAAVHSKWDGSEGTVMA